MHYIKCNLSLRNWSSLLFEFAYTNTDWLDSSKTRNRFSSLITNNSTTKNPMLMVFNRNCCQYVCKKLTPTIEHGLNLHVSIVIIRGREIDFRRRQQPRILYAHKFYAL